MTEIRRKDPCPCGKKKSNGEPRKYKNCCEPEKQPVPQEVLDYFRNNPPIPEPFEKGGFLTGRPFITETFQGTRIRAVGNVVYRRSMDETFHLFILRRLAEELTQKWVESEEKKSNPHILTKWFDETQTNLSPNNGESVSSIRSVPMSGNMRALLALAYDFYTLQHCAARVPQNLLNRLRDENQFQGARYEIAIAGLACRSGFDIRWVSGTRKHCEFTGIHKITGDKAAFEVKSHHRKGVLGKNGKFDPGTARTKIIDHIKEALEQTSEDLPMIIFDDLNLPLTSVNTLNEEQSFNEVESDLKKYKFFDTEEYKRCGVLFITNFSWHFHKEIPPQENEIVAHFHQGGKYSLKQQTIMDYLMLSAKQYGFVPILGYEFKKK